jgi:rubredoxin
MKIDCNAQKRYFYSINMAKKKTGNILQCPVCLSDKLDVISPRMKKCDSCGFIWNHEVSDRDNLLLIVEHQNKIEKPSK